MIRVVFLLPQIIGALPAPRDIRIRKYSLDVAAQHPAVGYFPAGPSFLIVAAIAAAARRRMAVLDAARGYVFVWRVFS